MSEKTRSFFATIPGVITGLAGVLTAIVGLVTVLIQLEVIGGDGSNNVATTGTTVAPAGGGAAGPATTVEPGSFTVSPNPLNFGLGDPKEKVLTVRNTSSTATLAVQTPLVAGKDAARFTVAMGDCGRELAPKLSCNLRVTFAPAGPLANYEATVQVLAPGAPQGAEVKLTGTTLLS